VRGIDSGDLARFLGVSSAELDKLSESQTIALKEFIFLSSISASDQMPQVAHFIASNPDLYPPSLVNAALGQLTINNHEMISSMLDKWSDSLEEQAIALREKNDQQIVVDARTAHERNMETIENKAISRADFARQIEAMDNQRALMRSVKEVLQAEKESSAEGVLLFAGLILVSGLVGQALTVSNALSVSPLQQASATITALDSTSQALMQTALPAINLFITGLIYQNSVTLLAKGMEKGAPPKDREFAQKLGLSVLKAARGNEVHLTVRAFIINEFIKDGEKVTEQRMQELISIAKLLMLSTALALLYKVDTGKLTDQEFAGMLTGENHIMTTELSHEALEKMIEEKTLPAELAALGLISQIHKELALLSNLEERTHILEGILNYMDSDPSVDALLDPLKPVKQMLQKVPNPSQPA
jgi:hypothetical protein